MTKILICFDGTGNEMGNAEDDSLSNIAKIAIRAGWMGNEQSSAVLEQKVLYYPGPGTRGGPFLRTIRKLSSPEATIGRIVRKAEKDLNGLGVSPEDEIIIIGFSRGAAIARRFAALLGNSELNGGKIFAQECPVKDVKLLICFDTVAQIGRPDRSDYPDDSVVFEDNVLSATIGRAYHLVSIDEHRSLFPATLMGYEEGERITEVWFRGVHSDVGGGYPEHGLSDVTLEYAVDKLEKEIVVRDPSDITIFPEGIEYPDIHFMPDPFAVMHLHRLGREERMVHVIAHDRPSSEYQPKVHTSVRLVMDKSRYLAVRNTQNWTWVQ